MNDSEAKRPTQLDDYNIVYEEVKGYQREMHQTWLWAVLGGAAVYSAVGLKGGGQPGFVSWVVPVLVLVCWLRYWHFGERIEQLCEYLCLIEKDAFPQNDASPPGESAMAKHSSPLPAQLKRVRHEESSSYLKSWLVCQS